MRILRDLQNVIASEYYKTRHDVAAKLFLFFPVLLTVAFIVYDLWNLSQEGYDGTNLWIYNIGRTLFMFYGMLYPLMAALFCAAYIGKEFKNDNYLLLFLFPVPRGTVYVAKLIYLLSMTFLSVLIAYVAFMLSGFILGVCLPSMGFQNFDVRILVISVFLPPINFPIIKSGSICRFNSLFPILLFRNSCMRLCLLGTNPSTDTFPAFTLDLFR